MTTKDSLKLFSKATKPLQWKLVIIQAKKFNVLLFAWDQMQETKIFKTCSLKLLALVQTEDT